MLTRQHPLPAPAASWWRSRPRLVRDGAARALVRGVTAPVATVDEALVRLCLAALLGAVVWAWLATLSVVAEAWRGRAGRRRAAAPLRRLVLLCCGAVLAAPVGTASGDEQPAPRPGSPGCRCPTAPPVRPSARPVDPTRARTVVVRAGDCLWRLAAADLPAGACRRPRDRALARHPSPERRGHRARPGPDPPRPTPRPATPLNR